MRQRIDIRNAIHWNHSLVIAIPQIAGRVHNANGRHNPGNPNFVRFQISEYFSQIIAVKPREPDLVHNHAFPAGVQLGDYFRTPGSFDGVAWKKFKLLVFLRMSVSKKDYPLSLLREFIDERANHWNDHPRPVTAKESPFRIHEIVEQIDYKKYTGGHFALLSEIFMQALTGTPAARQPG
jgi:hypothetical protein